jgi:signal transduction histidine kinase
VAADNAILRTVALLAAVGVGMLVGATVWRSADSASAAASPEKSAGQTLVSLREENLRLKAELARRVDPPQATPTPASDRPALDGNALSAVERLRVMADLSKRGLVSPMIITFSSLNPGRLSDSFVELFGITPPERETLQASVDRVRERLAVHELENASLERTANGDASVKIRAFPQAGAAIHDELMRAFSETLGAERQGIFLAMAAHDLEQSLGGLGTFERNFVFSRNNSRGGNRPFSVEESQTMVGGSNRRRSDFKTFDEMARSVGTAARLLPKDFADGK